MKPKDWWHVPTLLALFTRIGVNGAASHDYVSRFLMRLCVSVFIYLSFSATANCLVAGWLCHWFCFSKLSVLTSINCVSLQNGVSMLVAVFLCRVAGCWWLLFGGRQWRHLTGIYTPPQCFHRLTGPPEPLRSFWPMGGGGRRWEDCTEQCAQLLARVRVGELPRG